MSGTARGAADEPFEALYRQLDETVRRLEDGNLPLDEAIDLYEQGMRLAKRCGDHLTTATLRIRQIQIDYRLDGDQDGGDPADD
ncbi:MAG TPA: exodeoxyribonuclease VII small subunit [Dehalococcoidia bacterium]|nr:exodeoxyribonuclease VII small subunit [Dehalococcoidia bacterium]